MTDVRELRRAFGTFMTGVTVITTVDTEGRPRGFTANSFASVSIDPPLLLICVAKSAASHSSFVEREAFAVNILAETQRDVSVRFASQQPDKFEVVPWHRGELGSPILEGVVGWFECRTHGRFDAGDHVVLVGRVEDFSHSVARPLGYVRGAYFTPALEQDAIAAAARPGSMIVGGLLDCAGGIVLVQDADSGAYHLPEVCLAGGSAGTTLLMANVSLLGLRATISFVFSVYEEADKQLIYYRGSAVVERSQAGRYVFNRGQIPWNHLRDGATTMMLERYFAEREEGAFGVYSGSGAGGLVARLAYDQPGTIN